MPNAIVTNLAWGPEHGKEVLVEVSWLRAGEAATAGQRSFPFDVNLAGPIAAVGGGEDFEEVVSEFQLVFSRESAFAVMLFHRSIPLR
jgi:hypothetical protein